MCSRVQPCRSQISLTWSNWVSHSAVGAVQLDDQRRGHADGVAGVHGLLGGLDREGVHHLDGGGHDPGADDVADHVARRADRREVGEQRPHRLGCAQQPHDDLRGDPQRALGAEEHPAQVRPGLLAGVRAEGDHRPVGQHHLHLEHVVRGEPVLQAVRAAGVLRDVAADRADLLAAGVGRVVEPVRRGGRGDLQVRDAGLDDGAAVDRVDLQDPLEPGQRDHHAVRDGQRTTGQAGARAAGDERHPVPRADPDGGGDLRGVAGEQHELGDDPVAGQPVALVGAALDGIGDHVVRGEGLLERRTDRSRQCHRSPPRRDRDQPTSRNATRPPGERRPVVFRRPTAALPERRGALR